MKLIRSRILTLQLLALLLVAVISCAAYAGTTTRVSVANDGTQGNLWSYEPAISADGRFVAFASRANNLVPGDTNESQDIFVHDRVTGIIERVSVASNGTQGNDDSGYNWSTMHGLSISADGRFVAFESRANNLVSGDTNGYIDDVFVHDCLTGQTVRVSVASDGTQGNGNSLGVSISADGQYVAFESCADNLVPGDANGGYDVFVHDRLTGQTERVSVASDGTEGIGGSGHSSISADGRYVAFESDAYNLIYGDITNHCSVFVHDRSTGQTERVSESSDGTQGNKESYGPSISADGRFVAFESDASNLVLGDTNGYGDIFVHDRLTGQNEIVSVASGGTQSSYDSCWPSISADGRFVAFCSNASNLVPGDTNDYGDIFVHCRLTGQTVRVSIASNGTQENSGSAKPSISADGRFVAFYSNASNFVPGDSNGCTDVFVHDRFYGMLIGLSSKSEIWCSLNMTSWFKIPGTLSKLAVGDFNGDWRWDIAGLSSTGKIYYTTNGSTWMNIPGAMSFLTAGDLNGDGSDDLAGLTSAGSIYYSTNKSAWMKISGTLTKLVTGDFDGNGADDIAGLTAAGKIYYSTNKTTWTNIPGAFTSLTAGDYNGDGVDDIAVLNSTGKIYYTTNKSAWKNIPGTLVKLVTGDFNGDGKDDIAGLNSAGKVYYTTNKTSWANIPGALAGLVTGDFNGDGKDDIAGLTAAGKIYYTINKTGWTNIPGTLTKLYSAR